MEVRHAPAGLALVRLSLILPVISELDRRRSNTEGVLASNGLVRDTVLDQDVFVPPVVVHRFLEDAAATADDPHLCLRVGEALDDVDWPPLVEAASRAKTLGELLVRFIRGAVEEASSARHILEIGPEFADYRERRTSEPPILPAQNDAFTAGYTLRLLRRGAGSAWKPEEVRLTVCDPSALPEAYLGTRVRAGDRMGMAVRFPSAWLLQPFDLPRFRELSRSREGRRRLPTGFLWSLHHSLTPHLHVSPLTVDFVARLLGTSRQSLQRRLRSNGTTLSEVVQTLRKERAITELVQSRQSVGEIGLSVGYPNPTSFSRAFRMWTGESPRAYRQRRSP